MSKLGSAEYQFIKKTVTQLFLLAQLLCTPIDCWREVTWLYVISLLAISAVGACCLKAECGKARGTQELSGHLLCSLGPTTFVFPHKEMPDEKKQNLTGWVLPSCQSQADRSTWQSLHSCSCPPLRYREEEEQASHTSPSHRKPMRYLETSFHRPYHTV